MHYFVHIADQTLELEIERSPNGSFRVRHAEHDELQVSVLESTSGLVTLHVGDRILRVVPAEHEVLLEEQRYSARPENALLRTASRGADCTPHSVSLVASMPGRIVRVSCETGTQVRPGTALIVIEAMKMQNELCAKADGVVRTVNVQVGQDVERGAVLVEFE